MNSMESKTRGNEIQPNRRISINFEEFGVPLTDLKKSGEKDKVPKILRDIINSIQYLEPKKPYFANRDEVSHQFEKISAQKALSAENILLYFLKSLPQPLVGLDVTNTLLKIQEKYGADHPYLCNSRFRHALHQLPHESHAVLHHLFHFLNSLCMKDVNSDSDHSDTESQSLDIPTCQHLGGVFVEYIFGNDWKSLGGHIMSEDFLSETECLLSRILSEFISEYRAIFEIESTIEHIVHEEREAIDADFHEHRKRHDMEDECPEDIKAMKVAWDELSLECTGSREASPAKLSKKEDCVVRNGGLSYSLLVSKNNSYETEDLDIRGISTEKIEKNTVKHSKRIDSFNTTENRNRIDFVKTFFHSAAIINNNSATTTPENKPPSQTDQFFSDVPNPSQSCEPECCGRMGSIKDVVLGPGCKCPRKRKERQDSTSEQDSKFSRSSSLEFPVPADYKDCKVKWRSASVSPMNEDFNRGDHVLHEVQECLVGNNTKKFAEGKEDQSEVFSRPRKKLTRNRKNRKGRCDSLKENDQNGSLVDQGTEKAEEVQEQVDSNESDGSIECNTSGIALVKKLSAEIKSASPSQSRRIPSPSETSANSFKITGQHQSLEEAQSAPCWVSQHLQHVMRVDTAKETMTLDNESPRTFDMINSEKHLEHNQHLIERRLSEPSSPKRNKQKQLSRQLSSVKRKIEQLEQAFQEKTGYRPSYADKMNNSDLKKFIIEQARLKKDLKTHKENSEVKETVVRKVSDGYNKSIDAIRESLSNIEKKLEESRALKLRPFDLDFMSLEQIFDEKLEMQTFLLEFEKVHGHPETKEEKDAMKDLYERYRSVKRLARRSSSAKLRENATDLAAIPEDEAISLTLASPGHRIILSIPTCYSRASKHLIDEDDLPVSKHDMDLPDIEHVNREDEHWHSMSRDELVDIQRRVREEKKQLRRTVKEFEETFKTKTGRKLQKEDREPFDKTYQLYKTTKSKLKLIDALLSKP